MYANVSNGAVHWDDVEKIAKEGLGDIDNAVSQSISSIQENFTEYDGLIYDGAYSSHLESATPKLVESLEEVTIEEAMKKAEECIKYKFKDGENVDIQLENIEYLGEVEGKISLYNFKATFKNESVADIQITKKGGLLYLMVEDRKVDEENISEDDAKTLGNNYLTKLGLSYFTPTYTITQNGMMTINYAATQDECMIYPDLIKVKIALDNGEVCSVECAGYIFNHSIRDIQLHKVDKDKITQNLSTNIEVLNIRPAIIPTKTNDEILTYEISCKVQDRDALIYVNANTYVEEQILIILDTDGGKLTM